MARWRLNDWRTILWVIGPGVMVMLADTDAGSIITAAQTGAQWGYHLILPLLILIPVLYLVQEMTVRLGVVTGKGHGELIREHFGWHWALLSVSTLFLAAVGALVTEFAGVAGVGMLFGLPSWFSVGLATLLLITLGLAGQYQKVEWVGIAAGLFEFSFLPAAILAKPKLGSIIQGIGQIPWHRPGYLFILAANVGAVIMPWMIFYQQGAVVDKGLDVGHLRFAKFDTLIGSFVTQAVMIFVVLALAATVGVRGTTQNLLDVREIADALVPFLGVRASHILFGLGMLGASFIAALVVSVAGAWGIGEAFGFPHSLNHNAREAPWFYGIYTFAHLAGAVVVILSVSLTALTLDVEVMNAILLPVVLGFLLALEARALPPEHRMKGAYRNIVWSVAGVVMAFGLYVGYRTLFPG